MKHGGTLGRVAPRPAVEPPRDPGAVAVLIGAAVLAAGAGMVYVPAGVMVLGAELVVLGLYWGRP